MVQTLVACVTLCGGPTYLQAGNSQQIPDAADGCGTGGGGGDPSHGTSPGGWDRVTGGWLNSAAATGGPLKGCTTCGAGGGGGGGGSSACCSAGDDDNGGWGGSSLLAGDRTWALGASTASLSVGVPVWYVSEPQINLWLYDEPLPG